MDVLVERSCGNVLGHAIRKQHKRNKTKSGTCGRVTPSHDNDCYVCSMMHCLIETRSFDAQQPLLSRPGVYSGNPSPMQGNVSQKLDHYRYM